jgi:hypothetical protein
MTTSAALAKALIAAAAEDVGLKFGHACLGPKTPTPPVDSPVWLLLNATGWRSIQ